jgi:hypothetical protein
MSMAVERFEELKKKFRQTVPHRRLSPEQHRAIAHAASIEQVREVTAIEATLGKPYDQAMMARMSIEITTLLVSAGAKFGTRTK